GPDSARRILAKELFDEEYCFNAGKFVILSWLFKGKAEWADKEWEEALSKGALTVHLAQPVSRDEAHSQCRCKLEAAKEEGRKREWPADHHLASHFEPCAPIAGVRCTAPGGLPLHQYLAISFFISPMPSF